MIEYGYEAQLRYALAWGRVENEGTIESVCVRGKPRFGEISLRCDFRDLAVSIGLNGDFKGLTGYSSIQP